MGHSITSIERLFRALRSAMQATAKGDDGGTGRTSSVRFGCAGLAFLRGFILKILPSYFMPSDMLNAMSREKPNLSFLTELFKQGDHAFSCSASSFAFFSNSETTNLCRWSSHAEVFTRLLC